MNESAYRIIKAPVITEESTIQSETRNQYVFKVDPKSNKSQIRDAVERVFNVKVTSVNTMNYKGKKRTRGRTSGYTANWKKAIITLRDGDKIDLI
jgi:large subunit ribosomal protein L23